MRRVPIICMVLIPISIQQGAGRNHGVGAHSEHYVAVWRVANAGTLAAVKSFAQQRIRTEVPPHLEHLRSSHAWKSRSYDAYRFTA